MARPVSDDKRQIHAQRAARLDRRRAALLAAEEQVETVEPAEPRAQGRKLKVEELGLSDDPNQVIIGMSPNGRHVVNWEVGDTDRSLLIAGYGVPHTSYLLQSIIGHYRNLHIPIYGIDNMDILSGYPRDTFERLLAHRRNEGVEMLTKLVTEPAEKVLIITQFGAFLNPASSNLSDAAAANTRQEILDALHPLIQDDHTHVILTTSKLLREADLPTEIITAFTTRIIVGRIFANEAPRFMTESEKESFDKASVWHSLLQQPDEQILFQHARPGLLRNY